VPLVKGRCPAFYATRVTTKGERVRVWRDEYDYKGLIKLMKKAKEKFSHERQVILTADRHVPYKVVVSTMDALRGVATEKCTGDDGCLFDQVILSAGVQ
jgi:biopolymer transport protein ExbD